MNFLGMGPMELMLILVLAMIVFGPGKLPEIAGQVGKVVRDFRRTTAELSGEFNRTLSLEIEERKAATAQPAAPAAPAVPYEPAVAYEPPAAPVVETIAPSVEPAEAPPVVETPQVSTPVATAPEPPATTPQPELAVAASKNGTSKRRTYDADLAPPY